MSKDKVVKLDEKTVAEITAAGGDPSKVTVVVVKKKNKRKKHLRRAIKSALKAFPL